MQKMKTNYINMMKMELGDLKQDISLLIEKDKNLQEKGKLTNYVYKENMAVYNNLILGLDLFVKILDETDPEQYSDVTTMITQLNKLFHEKIKEHGLADGIHSVVERKMKKVEKYVDSSHCK